MKQSESIGKLAAALVAAQKDLKPVAKDAVNPAFRSRFASLDVILETVRPILAAQNLAVVQGADAPILDESGALCGFSVETMLIHASGEWLSSVAVMPLAKVDPQGSGSAMTYGRRYSLSALLALATDDDDDGNTASPRPATTSAPRPNSLTASQMPTQGNGAAHGKLAGDVVMPFGKTKGKKLSELPREELEKTRTWCREKDAEKFKDLIASLTSVIASQQLGIPAKTAAPIHDENELHPALRDDGPDDLPF